MQLWHLFDGVRSSEGLVMFSALALAYGLGLFSMFGWRRRKLRSVRRRFQEMQTERVRLQSRLDELTQARDLLGDESLDPVDRIDMWDKEMQKFKIQFQDSIEFYLHSIEELIESNHELTRRMRILERENQALIKQVWSDEAGLAGFKNDISDSDSDEAPRKAGKEAEAKEAAKNVKSWVKALQKKNYTKDDLTAIKGISDELEKRINALGIISYEQLSQLDDALIEDLAKAIQYFAGRIKKEDWVGQAYQYRHKSRKN